MCVQSEVLWITVSYPQQRSSSLQSAGNAHTVERLTTGRTPHTGGPQHMTGLKVSPQQLSTLGGSCARTATDIRGQQVSLKTQLTPLFGADWSGAAATQFAALYEQFNKNAEGLTAALEGIGSLLGHAGQSYAAVEEQIAASFRG
jgi:WXG100 family type VII secretion target